MTNKQESRLSMYLKFRDFQAAYTAVTASLPNYATNATIFTTTILQLQAISAQQRVDKKGVAEGKNIYRDALNVITADYSRKLVTYAKFAGNPTLAQEVKVTESKLRQAPDTAVRDYGQIMYDKAQPLVASLGAYGITAATQTALLNGINAFNGSIGKPGATRTESTVVTKQLALLFKMADDALANMDLGVEIVRLTQVNFYNGYKNARKVVETGVGSLAVNGLVTDGKTGEPVKGVTVAFTAADGLQLAAGRRSSTPHVVKKSADKGGFKIKSLPTGTYQVLLTKAGYADQFATVSVNDGELTDLKLTIDRV